MNCESTLFRYVWFERCLIRGMNRTRAAEDVKKRYTKKGSARTLLRRYREADAIIQNARMNPKMTREVDLIHGQILLERWKQRGFSAEQIGLSGKETQRGARPGNRACCRQTRNAQAGQIILDIFVRRSMRLLPQLSEAT